MQIIELRQIFQQSKAVGTQLEFISTAESSSDTVSVSWAGNQTSLNPVFILTEMTTIMQKYGLNTNNIELPMPDKT
jgi:hypothetical protein